LDATTPDAYIFTGKDGKALDYSSWRRRVWLLACKQVGLEGLGFHDLRRMAATALVITRTDMKTAQARLGNADPNITLGLYAQATTDADREAARQLGEYLTPKETKVRKSS
jgi:integrase